MLDALIKNLDGMVYCSLYDARRSLVFVGGNCNQLAGYETRSLLCNPAIYFEVITHPEDREWVRHAIDDAISTGRHYYIEYRSR